MFRSRCRRRALLLGLALAVLLTAAGLASERLAAQPILSMVIDRGEGALYQIGEPLTVFYVVDAGAWVRFSVRTNEGSSTLAEGYSTSGLGTVRATVGPPEGRHTIVAEVLSDPESSTVLASTETWFTVIPASASPAPSASQPAATPAPAPQRVVVSGADNGRTVTVTPGSTVDVSFLDLDYRWSAFQYDSYVIQLESAPGIFPASFRARNPGTTVLSATGQPLCRDTSPPCAQPDRQFQVIVIVQ